MPVNFLQKMYVFCLTDSLRYDVIAVCDHLVPGHLEEAVELDGPVPLLLDDGMVLDHDGVGEHALLLKHHAALVILLLVGEGERGLGVAPALGRARAGVLVREDLASERVLGVEGDGHRGGRAHQAH